MIERFWPATKSWAVRRSQQRYEKLCKLATLLEQDTAKTEEDLMLWAGMECYSYDTALDLCLSRALSKKPMPWIRK